MTNSEMVEKRLAIAEFGQIKAWARFNLREYFDRDQQEDFLRNADFNILKDLAKNYLTDLCFFYTDDELINLKKSLEN